MRSRTWACLYEPHLTSRLLVKTSIPAQTLICAQHMYTHFTVSSTERVKTHKHPQQYALNSTTSISSKIHNWIGLDIKHSSLAAAQESNIQENNSLKYLIKRKDYCKLNLMARFLSRMMNSRESFSRWTEECNSLFTGQLWNRPRGPDDSKLDLHWVRNRDRQDSWVSQRTPCCCRQHHWHISDALPTLR